MHFYHPSVLAHAATTTPQRRAAMSTTAFQDTERGFKTFQLYAKSPWLEHDTSSFTKSEGKFQQTLGTYKKATLHKTNIAPKNGWPIFRGYVSFKEGTPKYQHERISESWTGGVEGLGYLPGVCWSFLRQNPHKRMYDICRSWSLTCLYHAIP